MLDADRELLAKLAQLPDGEFEEQVLSEVRLSAWIARKCFELKWIEKAIAQLDRIERIGELYDQRNAREYALLTKLRDSWLFPAGNA